MDQREEDKYLRMKEDTGKSNMDNFQKRVWTVCGIAALFIIVIWILKVTFNVLLLVLAGSLIALYFHGISKWIAKKTSLPEKGCLAVSIVGTVLMIALTGWLIGAKISQQFAELSETLPETVQNARSELGKSELGQKILNGLSSAREKERISSLIGRFFRSTFGVLGDVYVVIFLGIFFTVSPQVYVRGVLKLIPVKARPRGRDILNRMAWVLSKWLKGKILAMFVVAALTATGLAIMGVPMVFALAIIAGLLNFIPNFGPLIAMIPAVLVGLMQGPGTALMIGGLYILVQVAESNFITPQIQKRLIHIPPALIIIAQLLMGLLTGAWGIVLATPVIAVVIVILEETYLKKES